MTNKLIKLEDRILELLDTDKIISPREIATVLKVPEDKVREILNNDIFYDKICANSLSKMRLAYHTIAIPHLLENLQTEVKFYESYDRLSKAIGALKEKDNESVKLSLEVLLKEKKVDKEVVELEQVNGNIFELKDSAKVNNNSPVKELEFEFEE
jgi:phage antirepressor YoqD-like protein